MSLLLDWQSMQQFQLIFIGISWFLPKSFDHKFYRILLLILFRNRWYLLGWEKTSDSSIKLSVNPLLFKRICGPKYHARAIQINIIFPNRVIDRSQKFRSFRRIFVFEKILSLSLLAFIRKLYKQIIDQNPFKKFLSLYLWVLFSLIFSTFINLKL